MADRRLQELGNATVVTNNPPGVVYRAQLPEKAFFTANYPGGNVKGSVTAVSAPNGVGVAFRVDFANLPKEGGPFMYHLHVAPVPENGNCTETLAHLDPFIRGEATECDARLPQTCQVGDLSGKWGNITSDPFHDVYVDDYASLVPGLGSFFGNRSIVLHFSNKTRITCANFELVAGTPPEPECTSTVPGSVTTTPVRLPPGSTAPPFATGSSPAGATGTGGVVAPQPSRSTVPVTVNAAPATSRQMGVVTCLSFVAAAMAALL